MTVFTSSPGPRRTAGWVQVLLVAAVMLGGLPAPVTAAPPVQQPPPVEKVLVFSLPRITWADVAGAELPHLTELLARGMVAQLSVRTAGSRTSAADGYATIGAGNRADGADSDVGGYALQRDEPVDGRAAHQAFEARVGEAPVGEVLHLGIATVRRENRTGRYGAEPGALGSALNGAGMSTAVIANADKPALYDRSAALAVMDHQGVVDGGQVSADLLQPDPTAPYGFGMNQAATVAAFGKAWQAHDLTLVEPSDLERVDQFQDFALPEAWQSLRRAALAKADELLGKLLEQVDLRQHLVLVVTPAAPQQREELGVFGMTGRGIEPGVAVSGSTRRDGYLTLPDIAPSILERLGVPIPASMTGTPIKLGEARPVGEEMFTGYVRANQVAVFRDQVTGPVTVVFIVLQVLAYLLASLMLILRGWRWPGPRWRPATRFLLLTVLAMPTTTFLSGLLPYDKFGAFGYLLGLVLGAAGLVAGSVAVGWAVGRRLPAAAPLLPPLLIVTVTWITMIVDVLFYYGRLQLLTVFGYSPIVAGRFSGYGNFAFSLVAICAVIMVTGGWAIAVLSRRRAAARAGADHQAAPPGRGWRALALLVAAALLGFTVVVDGYPAYGSDVGGVLAAVPSFALVVLLLAGIRINWRRLVLVGLVTVATIGAFAAVDLSRPVAQRTHLGRLVERVGDAGGAVTIIERKLFANLHILTSSIWTWVVPIGAAFLIVLAVRRFGGHRSALASLWSRVPGMPACLWGAAVVAALGFALNDSGIAVPAMMSTMLLPYLGYLVLREPAAPAAAGELPGNAGEPHGDAAEAPGDAAEAARDAAEPRGDGDRRPGAWAEPTAVPRAPAHGQPSGLSGIDSTPDDVPSVRQD